ncbi:MAG TPA: thiol-disulfide oxidoreductase DCC family protein [Chitinophagaceae bacterium]|nr:thiol-disulfide oxidoreductase DCC family protein [Chitinophagaceae bacterium]
MYDLKEIKNPVILFDGVCNLCSGFVQFIIKHDPRHQFRFASLQSEFGKKVMQYFGLPVDQFNSFILLEDGKIYTRSTGALRVAKKLNRSWSLLYSFIVIPRFIRDSVYNFIARKRYKWFGKKEECWIPTPELKSLFLDAPAP